MYRWFGFATKIKKIQQAKTLILQKLITGSIHAVYFRHLNTWHQMTELILYKPHKKADNSNHLWQVPKTRLRVNPNICSYWGWIDDFWDLLEAVSDAIFAWNSTLLLLKYRTDRCLITLHIKPSRQRLYCPFCSVWVLNFFTTDKHSCCK